MNGKIFRGPSNYWLMALIIVLAPLAFHGCSESAPVADTPSAAASIASSKAVLRWLDPPKPYKVPEDVDVDETDPEYWAVMHIVIDRHLTMDVPDRSMTKDALDCAESKIRAIAKWSQTLPNAKVRSAWALWLNLGLDVIAKSRIPEPPEGDDPEEKARNRTEAAGVAMMAKLSQPPEIQCLKP